MGSSLRISTHGTISSRCKTFIRLRQMSHYGGVSLRFQLVCQGYGLVSIKVLRLSV